jgi:acyl-CoA synthetase (AMP-forming)/AMP-acid ligase II
MPSHSVYEHEMLFAALERQATKQPKRTAVVDETRSLSYSEFLREAKITARTLQSTGLKIGDHLLIGIPPSTDFFVLFYAAAAIGVIAIPVAEFGKLSAQIAGPSALSACGAERFLAGLERDGIRLRHRLLWSRRSGSARNARHPLGRRVKIFKEEPVTAVSTSGTTGDPVLHPRSAEFLCRRAALRIKAWGITSRDVIISAGPFTSGANLDHHVILPIIVGCKVVVLAKFHRRKFIAAIEREKVTVLYSVPLAFEALSSLPDTYSPNLSSIRLAISNGAPLPAVTHERFLHRYGIRIAQSYSGSQVAPAFTCSSGKIPESVGQKDGLFPVAIVDDRGATLPAHQIGEIVFQVHNVKDRVLRASLQNNPRTRNGYLYSGDLGKLDAEGNLFLVGRKTSLIKVGANRVIPAEVEHVLRAHRLVRESVVFPINAGQPDEAVGATVVRDGNLSAQALLIYCAERLDGYKCPAKIFFRKALPRNPHGKVIRYLFAPDRARS